MYTTYKPLQTRRNPSESLAVELVVRNEYRNVLNPSVGRLGAYSFIVYIAYGKYFGEHTRVIN